MGTAVGNALVWTGIADAIVGAAVYTGGAVMVGIATGAEVTYTGGATNAVCTGAAVGAGAGAGSGAAGGTAFFVARFFFLGASFFIVIK